MARIRVIAGIARGMKLATVPGDITRPITDRVKEALFNILHQDMPNCKFFDLYAGTGSIGIEALSRGAKFARFNDLHRSAINTIKKNLLIIPDEAFSERNSHFRVSYAAADEKIRQGCEILRGLAG